MAQSKRREMSEDELRSVLNARLQATTANLANTVSVDRAKAIAYYRGDLLGNEVAGRSSVVSRDVQEAVDGIMPSLVKIFSAGDTPVSFVARPKAGSSPDQASREEQWAAQATDTCAWVWNSQNEGYLNTYTWCKDALIERIGVVKLWWDSTHSVSKEQYCRLTDEELALLMLNDDIEITAQTDYEDDDAPAGTQPAILHDVDVTVTRDRGRIRVECIPPEEFLFDYYATTLESARFLGHRTQKTRSDLREMGFSQEDIDAIPQGDPLTTSPDRLTRYADQSGMLFSVDQMDPDKASEKVWITEGYLRVDFDGDGYAEMRKITFAGTQAAVILENEEVDDHPFAVITPEVLPHRIEGQSIADKTRDIQQIKSTLIRQTLDNLYLSNNPQWGVVEGQVNIDDMLTARPGGIKRVKNPQAIFPLAVPFVADKSLPMIEYIDQVRELRTGMPKIGGELDASVLNSGATGANIANNTRLERVELIARTIAETGFKRAFRRILQLLQKYQIGKISLRLRGQYVAIDPREWKTEFDLETKVGLGSGNKDQMLMHLMPIKQTQEAILMQLGPQNPLVGFAQYHNTLADIVKNAGLGDPTRYFTDPSNMPNWQPPPHPQAGKAQADQQATQQQMQLAQMKAQADQQAAQARMQLEQQKAQQEMQLAQQRAALEEHIAQQKLAHDMEMERVRTQANIQIAREKAASDAQLARERAIADFHHDAAEARMGLNPT